MVRATRRFLRTFSDLTGDSELALPLTSGRDGESLAIVEFPPPAIGQHHRGFNLAIWYRPILPEEAVFLSRSHQSKAVFLVEVDRPYRICPRANQNPAAHPHQQVSEQTRSDPASLAIGANISVADQGQSLDSLQPHDPG